MTTVTTPTSSAGWRPDVVSFVASEVVPEALIMSCSTVVTDAIDGDAPLVRVPYVTDAAAAFVDEGAAITPATPSLSETAVATAKLAQVIVISREQYGQQNAANLLSDSATRAIVTAANEAFIAQAAPVAPAIAPAAGLLVASGTEDGGAVAGDLDALVDLVATLQDNGATPSTIVLAPDAWGFLRKFKTATGSNASLIGAGTADAAPSLLGIPVAVSNAVTAGSGLVIDKNAIVSAVGPVEVATSEGAYFASDSIALRVTWRFGHKLMHADRVGKFTVTDPA